MKLKDNELILVAGGAISSQLINAFVRLVSFILYAINYKFILIKNNTLNIKLFLAVIIKAENRTQKQSG